MSFDLEQQITDEERERARLEEETAPEGGILLDHETYMGLEVFMKDLISWAGMPSEETPRRELAEWESWWQGGARIRRDVYRYFARLPLRENHPAKSPRRKFDRGRP